MERHHDDAGDRAPRAPAAASGIEPRGALHQNRLDRIRRRVREGAYDSPRVAEKVVRRLLELGAL